MDISGSILESANSNIFDFTGSVSGTDLFFIDGDSLLLLICQDETLDLGVGGVQILNAIERAENFIHYFLAEKCNPHIVFFVEHRHALIDGCSPLESAARLLFRSSFIRHMQCTKVVPIYQFESSSHKDWAEYLIAYKPCVALVSLGDFCRSSAGQTILRNFAMEYLQKHKIISVLENLQFKNSKLFLFNYQYTGHTDKVFLEKLARDKQDALLELQNDRIVRELPLANGVSKMAFKSEKDFCLSAGINAIQQESSDEFEIFLCQSLVLYKIIQQSLPLNSRSFNSHGLYEDERFSKFVIRFLAILELAITRLEAEFSEHDVSDIFDGRLFAAVAELLADDKRRKILSPQLFDSFKQEASEILKINVSSWPSATVRTDNFQKPKDVADIGLIPIDSDMFEFLPSFDSEHTNENIKLTQTVIHFGRLDFDSNTQKFKDENEKKIELTGDSLQNKRIQGRARRQDQWFMDYIQKYAASLTGANGKALSRMIIFAGSEKVVKQLNKENDEAESILEPKLETPKETIKGKGGKKGAKLSKADLIRQENAQRKAALQEDKSSSFWEQKQRELLQLRRNDKRLAALDHLLRYGKDRDQYTNLEMQLFRIQILLNMWAEGCIDRPTKLENMDYAVQIFVNIKELYQSETLTIQAKKVIDKVLKHMGLSDVIDNKKKVNDGKEITFKFEVPSPPLKIIHDDALFVPFNSSEFQLGFCGEFMERNMGSMPDDRVSFEPDKWQRDLLDLIDQDASVLVVAPTSAGKTFASFYAMEKVLREDDDAVIVYLAPTRALVNQIAAEIHARFSKQYSHAGKSIWAIATGDYQVNDPKNCQILITDPDMLDTLLFSPKYAKSWTPRIKKIIFDEVHCISDFSETATWMHLLMFSPCPIMAISATIGNPEHFQGWLDALQKAHGYKVELIVHKHRFSDLRKFIWTPDEIENDIRTIHEMVHGDIYHIHPAASLKTGVAEISDDVSFEPRDSVILYRQMKRFETDSYQVSSDLEPSRFFSKKKFIAKVDVQKYEKALKKNFKDWLSKTDATKVDSPPQRVLDTLNQKAFSPLLELENKLSKVDESPYSREAIMKYFLPMLYDLEREDMLPGLFFNYDRLFIEELGQKITKQLSEAEHDWRENSEDWQQKLRAFRKWQSGATRRKKEQEKFEKDAKEKQKELAAKNQDDASWLESFDPLEPSSEFSFVGKKCTFGKEEFQNILRQLNDRNSCEPWAIEALRRGIGIHHKGLNRRYRSAVEMLFRAGQITVVIATGTLALGINMPCKTACFVGDDVEVNALNYRQASGRAGRRGFDLLGHVGFYGIKEEKIRRLLSSQTPSINVNYSFSETMLLRMIALYNNTAHRSSKFIYSAVQSVLKQPLYVFERSEAKQVFCYLRFQLEYLIRERYITPSGKPLAMAAFVNNLHGYEPRNFLFTALLQRGVFHKICAKCFTNERETLQDLIRVLAHLFAQVPLSPSQMAKENEDPSNKISLDPLPKIVTDSLEDHDRVLLEVLQAYTKTYKKFRKDENGSVPAEELPCSKLKFLAAESKTTDDANGDIDRTSDSDNKHGIEQELSELLESNKYTTRSPFVALSGHADDYSKTHEFIKTVHSKMFPPVSGAALVSQYDANTKYNSFIVDYFNNPNADEITDRNGISRQARWYLLKEFNDALYNIRKTMQLIFDYNDEIVDDEDLAERKRPMVPKIIKDMSFLDLVDEDEARQRPSNRDFERNMKKEAYDAIQSSRCILAAFDALAREFDAKFKMMWS